jgi:hypothetical protein
LPNLPFEPLTLGMLFERRLFGLTALNSGWLPNLPFEPLTLGMLFERRLFGLKPSQIKELGNQ